jgi:murein DD-endopeptidase MepM/ murein hydrolase activator NlpD
VKWRGIVLALFWLSATAESGTGTAPASESLELSWPVACRIGETCWIANYVDADAGKDAKDFRCRGRSYDGHDGVDIAIRDTGVMEQGMTVLAAAPGIVRRVRDGVEDRALTDAASRKPIEGRECGNGVLLDHESGWQTQYCHMKRGSLLVKEGERVTGGQALGQIGLSGKTEFPHLHLTVRHGKQVVDPFTGQPMVAGCGIAGKPLWRADAQVVYEAVALYNAGIAGGPPNVEMIRSGKADSAVPNAQSLALVLWVDILGVEAGDQIQFRLIGPDNKLVFENEQRVDRRQARRFVYAGKKRQGEIWQSGTYTGQVMLKRTESGRAAEHKVSRTATIQ